MLQRFVDYIDRQHLFTKGEEVLLAVSGGRDSVAMADLMARAGFRFAVAHCNFNLRPGDCDRDQAFVRSLADRLGATFHTVSFDTRAVAAASGESIEEAARRLRYEWFAALCRDHGYPCVATAHHRDDSVETFFLNLFRGTGIAGLHGIRPAAAGVVRPMLCFSRAEIDRYVADRGLQYVEDSTNLELDARRNRIRHQLMPLLRQLYPSVDATMEANIARLSDVEAVYRAHIAELRERLAETLTLRLPVAGLQLTTFPLSELAALSPRATLVYELLAPYGFSPSVASDVEAALDAPRTGSRFLSPTHEAVIDRDRLLVAPRLTPQPPAVRVEPCEPVMRPCGPDEALVDADRLRQPLSLRLWRDGDRFRPFGMAHDRLVSDFLKDCKLNLIEKNHLYLMVDADERIVWLVGLRADERFRLTSDSRTALRLSV